MKLAPETLAGIVLISALVAAGVWCSRDPDDPQWPLSYLSTGAGGGSISKFVAVNDFDWSADGQKLLLRFRGEGTAESRLALHDLGKGTTSIPFDVAGESAGAAALAPDGRHVLLGTSEGHLWWIDPAYDDVAPPLIDLPRRTLVTSVAITGDSRLVAGGTNSGRVYVYDLLQKTSIILAAHDQTSVAALRFSRDGEQLVGAQNSGRISLWNVATGESLREFPGHSELARGAEFLPDGKRLISAGLDDTVRIWDIASGRELWRGEFGLYGVRALAVSSDGNTAAWGGHNCKIVVWDLDHNRKKFEIATSATCIYHLQFSADGTTLATSGQEEVIRLYDMRTAAEKTRIDVTGAARL
jgi:WD40 repeat protein